VRRKKKAFSGFEGLLEIAGLEVTTEGISDVRRAGERHRERELQYVELMCCGQAFTLWPEYGRGQKPNGRRIDGF